jgi:hypothetical protein
MRFLLTEFPFPFNDSGHLFRSEEVTAEQITALLEDGDWKFCIARGMQEVLAPKLGLKLDGGSTVRHPKCGWVYTNCLVGERSPALVLHPGDQIVWVLPYHHSLPVRVTDALAFRLLTVVE